MKKSLLLMFAVLLLVSANASAEIKLTSLAKKKWTLVESANFKIVTDLSTKKARLTAEQLEKYRAFCALWLNVKPSENRSKMLMFLTQRSSTWKAMGIDKHWVSLYNSREGGGLQMFVNIAGFFGSSFRKPNSGRAVVLNAIAKELFNSIGVDSKLPVWFNTGFAFYLGTYSEPRGQVVLGDFAAYSSRISSIVNSGGGIIQFNSKELFESKVKPKKAVGKMSHQWIREVNRFYMQSFFTIHYLHSSNELRQQMFTYLRLVETGESQENAVKQALGKSFKELDKTLRKYASGSRLKARVMKKEEIDSMLSLPTSYEVSSIDGAQFFEFYAKALLQLNDDFVANQDKQSFLKEYKKRYLSDQSLESKL